MTQEIKDEINFVHKPLIFLKASVLGMGIVFVVLIFAFVFIKQKKSNKKVDNCQKFLQLNVSGEVDKIELQGNQIIILTKFNSKTNKQEIIKIDSNCAAVISKIELSQ